MICSASAVYVKEAFAYEYELVGKVGMDYEGNYKTNLQSQVYSFSIIVRNKQWQIKTMYNEEDYVLTFCDGTNIFDVLHERPKVISGAGSKENKTNIITISTTAVETGEITKGTQPINASWLTQMPWFAFASGDYLDSSSNQLIPPWLTAGTTAVANVLTNTLKRLQGEPHLPQNAVFGVSEFLKQHIMDSPNLLVEAKSSKFIKSFPDDLQKLPSGMVIGEYNVDVFTNCNGLQIPVSFKLRYNVPARKTVAIIIWGKLSNVNPSPSEQVLLPEIKGTLYVTDKRVKNRSAKIDYVSYEVTNGIWPIESDPIVIEAYKEKTGMAIKRQIMGINPIRLLFWVLLATTFCMPLFYLAYKFKNKKQKGKQ